MLRRFFRRCDINTEQRQFRANDAFWERITKKREALLVPITPIYAEGGVKHRKVDHEQIRLPGTGLRRITATSHEWPQ